MTIGRTFTREEVVEALREATKSVEDAGVAEDLRGVAFESVFGALLGLQAGPKETASAIAPVGREGDLDGPNADGPSLYAVAHRLAMSETDIADAYHVDGEAIGVGIAASRFDPRKAAGTKQVALLIAVGRQASGLEEWTRVGILRDAARDFGRFDPSNFATTIKEMGDVFNLRGRGQQVEVRVTRPGYERAANLLRELMSGEA